MSFLSNIKKRKTHSIVFEATRDHQFGKSVITAQAELIDIITVFEVDRTVQRSLNSSQVSSIMKYILERLQNGRSPIFFPPFIFSTRGYGEYVEKDSIYRLNLDDKIAVLDGQHRLEAFKNLYIMLKDSDSTENQILYEKLKRIPLTLQIYENLTLHQEQQLFTDINAKNTRVSANLIKYYDDFNITSKLMRKIVNNHPSIASKEFEVRKNTTRSKLTTGLIVYKLIALFDSGRIISNQEEYEFEKENEKFLEKKVTFFLTLLVKYKPSPKVYDRSKYIYLNNSIILGIAKFANELEQSKWEIFFKEVVLNYNWTHSNKDLRAARIAYNYETKRFRLSPESKVVNTVYSSLKHAWKGL